MSYIFLLVQISSSVKFLLLLVSFFVFLFRDMFHISESEDARYVDAVKQNILDGSSKWFAKIAITGTSIRGQLAPSVERSLCNRNVAGSIPASVNSTYEQHSLGNLICVVSHWELKVGVVLHFSNTSSWSSAIRKGDRLPRCGCRYTRPPRSTYLLTSIRPRTHEMLERHCMNVNATLRCRNNVVVVVLMSCTPAGVQ